MAVDPDLAKILNVLRGSPSFIVTETGTLKKVDALSPEVGLSMVAGQTVLSSGTSIESVFELQADGGELHGVYWYIEGVWWESSDEEARRLVAATDTDIFTFDWETAVPLIVDHFRGEPSPPRRPKLP